jgi:hypothetical protein
MRQRGGHATPGGVVGEDVGFEVDLVARLLDGSDQCRKVFAAALQQLQAVAVGEIARGNGVKGSALTTRRCGTRR